MQNSIKQVRLGSKKIKNLISYKENSSVQWKIPDEMISYDRISYFYC